VAGHPHRPSASFKRSCSWTTSRRAGRVTTPPKEICLVREGGTAINRLIEGPKYYDPDIYDEHFAKGGAPDARYGYADCGLPLVLHHNTPNNSVALLMSYEGLKFRGLFPRIQRHKEMS
jgi:hypothetical protein